MNPLTLYAAIAIIAASLSGAGAWRVQSWRYSAKDAQRIEAQAEKARIDRQAAQSASEGFEHDKAKNEIRYKTLTRQVEKIVLQPAYLLECLPDDGVRIINSAIATAGDTGEPADAVPEPR